MVNLVCPFRSQAPRGPGRLLPALREELSALPVQRSHKSKHKTDGNNQKDSQKNALKFSQIPKLDMMAS